MKLCQIIFVLFSFMLISCSSTSKTEILQNQNGNFVLYVSDQSFAISPVDVKIFIDDKLAIDDKFRVGNQHNWKEFIFQLEKGNHTLRAISIKGEATLEEQFEVKDRHWAVLDYWYYPETHYSPTLKHFNFRVQDSQIGFM
ncbi:MAG TPA: hypothetical protein VJJ52_06590 [Candidatus Nanoarchaeia archaeon]|nr:hypothetical protein [Candidatus Nanoarchaeia archaeon]